MIATAGRVLMVLSAPIVAAEGTSAGSSGVVVALLSGAAIVAAAVLPPLVKTRREATDAKSGADLASLASHEAHRESTAMKTQVDANSDTLRDLGQRFAAAIAIADERHAATQKELDACRTRDTAKDQVIAELARTVARLEAMRA